MYIEHSTVVLSYSLNWPLNHYEFQKRKMAPSKIEETSDSVHQDHHAVKASVTPSSYIKEPLQLKGVLDQFKSFDVTPVIGKEFVDVNLAEWLTAPNSDDLIRDLAITSKPIL